MFFNFSFLRIIAQFLSSLSNFFLLARVFLPSFSLPSYHTYFPFLFVALTHLVRLLLVLRDYRSVISIELTLVSNEIPLSLAPLDFLTTRFGPPSRCVVLTFRRRASGKWGRRCCMETVRIDFNRSVEKLWNFLPEIGRRWISGCDSPNRISNYLKRCAVGVLGFGTSSGASAIQRFASRYLSAWFVSVLVAL